MILILDGTCGFCQQSAMWLQRRLRQPISFRASQTLNDEELAAWSITRRDVDTAVYVIENGRVYRGAAAVGVALSRCRKPWPLLGRVIAIPGVHLMAELVYRFVAKNRHRLPGSTCGIGQNAG